MDDILRRTINLNQDIRFDHLRIYSGHVVITIKCEKALHISEELLEIAEDEGIDHDPIQSLHVTIFRNVGPEISNVINNNIINLQNDTTSNGLSGVELYNIETKKVIWETNIYNEKNHL